MDLPERNMPEKSSSMPVIHLRLYIAGNAPNSLRAIANLKKIWQQVYGNANFELKNGNHSGDPLPSEIAHDAALGVVREQCWVDVVDVWKEPGRALSDGILLTPTLRRLVPQPEVTIFGDLSETRAVLMMLGLDE